MCMTTIVMAVPKIFDINYNRDCLLMLISISQSKCLMLVNYSTLTYDITTSVINTIMICHILSHQSFWCHYFILCILLITALLFLNHFTPKLLRLIFELVRTPIIFSCTKLEKNLVWDNCNIDVTSFAGIYRFDMQLLTIFSSILSELELFNGSNVWIQTFRVKWFSWLFIYDILAGNLKH